MEICRDKHDVNIWLSQQEHVKNILRKFSMNNMKLVDIPLAFHFNCSLILCPNNKDEKDYISRISYVSRNFNVCDGMINIKYFTWS